MGRSTWRRGPALVTGLICLLAACGGGEASRPAEELTLYTCVSDTTIQPVLERFRADHPEIKVDLFRAPTGQLNARVAGDVRSGGLQADVVWACDPLTMQDYVAQGLVGGWVPDTEIPADVRTADYVGVAMLYVLVVTGDGVAPPARWADLPATGKVAVPDPRVAASALGALGYFGADFYAELKSRGAVQVGTPDDVTNGVAQGIYDAGITIANSAYAAQEDGSPIEVTWPEPGAVGVYGPAALSTTTRNAQAARTFLTFVTSREGQTVIATAGSYPTWPDLEGPARPPDAPTVAPDWTELGRHKAALLRDYAGVFGG